MLRCSLTFLLLAPLPLAADEVTVLTPESAGGPPRQMLTRHLKRLAHAALDRRRAGYEKLKTPAELAAYQKRLRKALLEQLGPLPERTPLNARVVSAIAGDRYRVEKVLFESQPGHLVTAVLYLPTAVGKPPFPVVVMPCGHSPTGKTAGHLPGVLLARHGIACFCYDPIGQGERYQLLGANGRPQFGPTTEHTLLGAASIVLGRNTATYRIWDGMRAIDFVAGRKDLDARKIGVSGVSGGGTLTSYLMALDDRVACAAPSCYVTSLRRLIDTIGPQDAEQNIHGQLSLGLDHADYLHLRAPKPTLILAATRDFFDIQGTWDSYREAKRFYTRLGHPERVALVETDTTHGYPKAQREAMLRWMRRWLVGVDEHATEGPEPPARPAADFQVTREGQVMLLPGARSVVELNVELNARLAQRRRQLWEAADLRPALAEVRRLAGIRPLDRLSKAKVTSAGTIAQDGHTVEKLIIAPETGLYLPALLYRPQRPTGGRTLYLDGAGKQAASKAIEALVRQGQVVLALDVRGVGEVGMKDDGLYGGNRYEIFLPYLLGRSLLGMRAEDVLHGARYLSEVGVKGDPVPVNLIATGTAAPPALHAAALERQRFAAVGLRGALPSYSDLVRHPATAGALVNTVHAALTAYDLPDLLRAVHRRK